MTDNIASKYPMHESYTRKVPPSLTHMVSHVLVLRVGKHQRPALGVGEEDVALRRNDCIAAWRNPNTGNVGAVSGATPVSHPLPKGEAHQMSENVVCSTDNPRRYSEYCHNLHDFSSVYNAAITQYTCKKTHSVISLFKSDILQSAHTAGKPK